MLKIYNTLSKKKQIFKPLQFGKVKLYVCGPTVYDYCHIGHARVYLAFDTIKRYMEYLGLAVYYIRNITDIDDKIIKRALENNEPISQLTLRFTKAMHEDFQQLNIKPPNVEPRATDFIPQMINMIQKLLDKGFAYISDNKDVYYGVQKFEHYGTLSHQPLKDLQLGARVAVNLAKHCPLDFVLWKISKPGELSWASPWGAGRPGWHIECSAMSLEYLGATLDIHGGGMDLIFPHHENERAQSEVCNQAPFVQYWMHVGFVQKNKEKMSKSLGNFLTIRDFLKHYHPEALRHFAISSHYRSPIDYTLNQIDDSMKGLQRLYQTLRGLDLTAVIRQQCVDAQIESSKAQQYEERFQEKMDDDFNTPEALALLFDLAHEINRLKAFKLPKAIQLACLLKKLANVLGILYEDPEVFLQHNQCHKVDKQKIEGLIKQRNEARLARQWAEADRIRHQLLIEGISLEDLPEGTRWQRLF